MTGRIFSIVEPWTEREAAVIAKKKAALDNGDAWAARSAGVEVYRRYYDEALARLDHLDMLPLGKAADRMKTTPEALIRKADRGQLVLIEIEGRQVVPDWTLDARGRISPFHLAIAREFAEGGQHDFFKFMGYLSFMGDKTLEFKTELPRKSMRDVFRAVGIRQGSCQVLVSTPMFEAADRALKNSVIMAEFINQMGAAVTRIGGMGGPNEGGLSDSFLNRYVPANIPQRDRWTRDPNFS